VFAQETIPSLVDRYPSKPPDLNKEPLQLPSRTELNRAEPLAVRHEPLPARHEPLPIRHDPLLPLRYEGDTFAERFGSYSRVKVDNFAQCEARMRQLQEEHAWLNDRLNRVSVKVEEYVRLGGLGGHGGYGGGSWNGYPHGGYPHGGGYLDGRESLSYMEAVRERERQNIGLEKDRMEYNLSAQRHHGKAERSAPFNNEDWEEQHPANTFRSKPDFNDEGPREGSKMVEQKFTRIEPEKRPPAEAKPKRTRKISSFKI